MIFALFSKRQQRGPTPAQVAYAAVSSAARRAAFYRELQAPDTLPGRFELTVLHTSLYLRRIRNEGPSVRDFAQGVFDEMVRSLESALRELGVGDLTVPKKMKAMVRAFYDGAATYDAALDEADEAALARALRRIVYCDRQEFDLVSARLARYVLAADRALAMQDATTLMSQGPVFPDPLEEVAR